jgi:hypothetical protein
MAEKDGSLHEIEMEGVDTANEKAVKGDDSDGRVDWTPRQVVASIFLSSLYVGK